MKTKRPLSIVVGFKAFVKQLKANHLDYCKAVVEKSEKSKQ